MSEGKTAMDGGFSFVEQGCESKRPGSGPARVTVCYELKECELTMLGYPQGKLSWGWRFLVTFFCYRKKVTRQQGETQCMKEEHYPNHTQNITVPIKPTASK